MKKRMLAGVLALVMIMTLLPIGTLAADGDGGSAATQENTNFFYFMSSADDDAIVVATKVLRSGDPSIDDFSDVVVPLDTTHGVAGWYADKELTTPVTELSYNAARTAPVPLYPKVEEGFWVTFDSNGGTYVVPQFYAGHASAPTNSPTKFGYTFAGWCTDETLTNTANFDDITEPATVYAKWEAADAKYTVIYWQENADDENYSYKESEYKTGTTGQLTDAVAKSYKGFTAPEEITQQIIKGDGTTIVNVYYERNTYDVKFWNVLYDGEHNGDLGEEFEDLCITAKHGASIRQMWPRNENAAWETKIGSWHIQANLDVMPLGGQDFYRVNPFGQESAEYYIEDLNGEYVLDHTDTGAPKEAAIGEEDQYKIIGFKYEKYIAENQFWSERDNCFYDEYGGAKFYYKRNSYRVAYMNKSENPVKETEYKYEADISDAADFVPDRPYGVPENYVFAGWYADEACTAAYDFAGKTMPADNVTVYAQWEPPVCEAKFIAYGQEIRTVTDIPYETDIAGQIPTVQLQENDEFYGWTYDEAGVQPFNAGTKITGKITLYAQIGNKNGYTVTYDANGGSGTVPIDSYRYARNRQAMALSGDGLTAPTGMGSTFFGWNTEADGSGTMYAPGSAVSVPHDITLYATWKENQELPIAAWIGIGLNTKDHYSYLIGYSDGTVRPEGKITRAEVATIFFRLLSDDTRAKYWSSENDFSDVPADKWYNNAVSTLCHMGVLGGYADGTFRPDAPISRAEFAKIAVSFTQNTGAAAYNYFTDVKTTDWFAPYVTAAKDGGLIEGYSDGSFKPENQITRAEACAIVNRVLGRKPSKSHMKISDRIDWPDCTTADWFYEAIMEATNSHTYQMGKLVETWNDKLPQRDWAALETGWANAYTGNGGEVR